jgi:hypothetical protein
MFVKIGKYKNFFGVYHLADLLQKFGIKEETCEKIGDFLGETFLNDFLLWIDKNKKRKEIVKIHDYDVWNLDYTLSLIILPSLKEYKEELLDNPWFPQTEEIKNLNDWVIIIDKMIWSFEHIVDESWEDEYRDSYKVKTWLPKPKRDEKPFVRDEKITGSLISTCFGFYDKERFGKSDYEGMKKEEEKIQEGLELFGKFFRFLWN